MKTQFYINGIPYTQWFKYGIEFLTPTNIFETLGWVQLWNTIAPIFDLYPKDPIRVIYPKEWNSDAELITKIIVIY